LDFVEVDAATNSGKADVQKITEEIQYSTFSGKRRIYLFDEAHQLSKDALDALLKPLEEVIPGTQEKRLICIFCTTEPEKMKATIFSRCAPTFVIQPVTPALIAKRLASICEKEGFEYDLDMLQVIAEITECHIRDALKAVEGVSMLGKLDRDNVAKYLRLDLNLMFVDILENIGKDLPLAMKYAKQALERSSPATCYERLAYMAMLAYQVGIGALKSPSYIDAGRLDALSQTQQQNLIGFAARFASRPGKPTEAMLLCDIGSLHYSGASVIGDTPILVVQNRTPMESNAIVRDSNISTQTHLAPVVPLAHNSGKLGSPPPKGKGGEVQPNPKAVGGRADAVSIAPGNKGALPEIEPSTFCSLVAMQIVHWDGESLGSTGRSNLDSR